MQIMTTALPYQSAKEMRAAYKAAKRRLFDTRAPSASPAETAIPVAEFRSRRQASIIPNRLCAPYELCVRLGLDWFIYRDTSTDESFTLGAIKRAVAHVYGIGREELDSCRRDNAAVEPRHVALAIAKRMTNLSLPELGNRMGGRDHTSVLHAVRKMQSAIDAVAAEMRADARPVDWVRAMRDHLAKK